jgi:hypothetical protein
MKIMEEKITEIKGQYVTKVQGLGSQFQSATN